jgi:hypothetical protein
MSAFQEFAMNRKLIAALAVAVTFVTTAPVFAHDWDNSARVRQERAAEIARDRAALRHDMYVHNRFGARNEREIARDRMELRRDQRVLYR